MSVIAEFVLTLHDDGSVKVSGFRSEVGAHQAAATAVQGAMPGAEIVEDPWAGMPATSAPPQTVVQQPQAGQWQQPNQWAQPPAPVQAQPPQQAPVRMCQHGQMKYFPNGQYGPFFACPLDRNDPNKCKTQKA